MALRGAELDKHLIFSYLLYSASTKPTLNYSFSPHLAKPLLPAVFILSHRNLRIFFVSLTSKFSIMLNPNFFYHKGTFYNINQIVKFETIGVTHHITFSTGEKIEVNTGHLDFKQIISVINPPYG